jgi:cytosine deaminase
MSLPTNLDPGHPYILRNLRAPAALVQGIPLRPEYATDGLAELDLLVSHGRFEPAPTPDADQALPEWDAKGRLILPGFVDMHVHLDKAYTVTRTGFSDHGVADAIARSVADAPNRRRTELIARMQIALQRAEANGTVALRTHLDTLVPPDQSHAWAAFDAVQDDWRGRMILQPVALMALPRVEQDDFETCCAQIAARAGVLGAFITSGNATPQRFDRLLAAAQAWGLDLDLHVDETLDINANSLSLLLGTAIARRHQGRIVAGHCCNLSQQPRDQLHTMIAGVAEAGIHIVALPMTNGFLQDRNAMRTPRLRGLTAVKELQAAGVNIAFASDNVRDAFYPFGDFDMLEVFRKALFMAQLEAEPAKWLAACTRNAAIAMGLCENRTTGATGLIRAGAQADAVLFDALSWADLCSGVACQRYVMRRGGMRNAHISADRSLSALFTADRRLA